MENSKNQIRYDFSKFKLTKILNNNSKTKTVYILGKFPYINEIDQAIIVLEKKSFTEQQLNSKYTEAENKNITSTSTSDEIIDTQNGGYFSTSTILEETFINDIYGNFECYPNSKINGIKTTIIYPASENHIQKYSKHEKHLIKETDELYRKITAVYLENEKFSLEWVYNILDHKKETDRIIYEDPCKENGFILLPDLKWDGKTIETLYLIAIVHRRDIKSIRDLNSTHLLLLKNIREKSIAAIEQKFNVLSSQLRIYIHYQPTFYHLHIHINSIKYDAPGIFCEKSHLLDSVINNIELLSDYYQKCTLSFILNENDKLFKLYENEYLNCKQEPPCKRPKNE